MSKVGWTQRPFTRNGFVFFTCRLIFPAILQFSGEGV